MNTYSIYTDGACTNNGKPNARAGWGAVLTNPQGDTLERCHALIDGGPLTDRHLALVMASRARSSTHLFVDQETAGPGMKDLIRTMGRARQKDLATDILERARGRPPEREHEPERQEFPRREGGISLGM